MSHEDIDLAVKHARKGVRIPESRKNAALRDSIMEACQFLLAGADQMSDLGSAAQPQVLRDVRKAAWLAVLIGMDWWAKQACMWYRQTYPA